MFELLIGPIVVAGLLLLLLWYAPRSPGRGQWTSTDQREYERLVRRSGRSQT